MDSFIESVDSQLTELVDKIGRYEPVESTAKKFVELDGLLVQTVAELGQHYDACRRLEELRTEGAQLDSRINDLLVELAQCRKELETPLNTETITEKSIDPAELLEYATKITRFTHKLPGSESVLPWPTEDQLRRGMLATLTLQTESAKDADNAEAEPGIEAAEGNHSDVEMQDRSPEQSESSSRNGKAASKPVKRPTTISLDMDSDED